MDADNWALVTDLYELTMANGFKEKLGEEEGVFDIFFRKMPDDGSFVVLAGLEQAVEELKNFHFEKEDIEYLKGLNLFQMILSNIWLISNSVVASGPFRKALRFSRANP